MLHSFDVVMDDMLIEPEEGEKIGEQLMPPRNIARQGFTSGGQGEAPIFLVFEEPVGIEPLDHVGDAGLRNLQTGRDVDDPGITLGIDELENPLQIIFDCGRVAFGFSGVGHGSGKINGLLKQVKIKEFGR